MGYSVFFFFFFHTSNTSLLKWQLCNVQNWRDNLSQVHHKFPSINISHSIKPPFLYSAMLCGCENQKTPIKQDSCSTNSIQHQHTVIHLFCVLDGHFTYSNNAVHDLQVLWCQGWTKVMISYFRKNVYRCEKREKREFMLFCRTDVTKLQRTF